MNAASPALRDLIDIGRTNQPAIPGSLQDDKAWQAFNSGPDSWVTVAASLEVDDIEHLIRGLVLYARASGRSHHGPTSPVVWLFLQLRLQCPEREAPVGAWVVANRVNPYDPFGMLDDGQAHTFEECDQRTRARVRASLEARH